MCFDDFDFGDLLGLGLAIGEEMTEEEIERLRIKREFEQDDEDNLFNDWATIQAKRTKGTGSRARFF